MSKTVAGYLMNKDGSSFDKTPAEGAAATPFRPYFVATSPKPAPTRSILIEGIDSSFAFGQDEDPSGDSFGEGDLAFNIHQRTISITSSLREETDVHIYNVSGLAVTTFTLQPGQTTQTRIPAAGVYIIRAANGRVQKKIAIK
jgi:hypothetical protein